MTPGTDKHTQRTNEQTNQISPHLPQRWWQYGEIQGQGSLGLTTPSHPTTAHPHPPVLQIPSSRLAAGILRPILLSQQSQGRTVTALISKRLAGPRLQQTAWEEDAGLWAVLLSVICHLAAVVKASALCGVFQWVFLIHFVETGEGSICTTFSSFGGVGGSFLLNWIRTPPPPPTYTRHTIPTVCEHAVKKQNGASYLL